MYVVVLTLCVVLCTVVHRSSSREADNMKTALETAAAARGTTPERLHMDRVTPRELAEIWPVRVVIRKDWDGKWAATWPSEIVRVGWSAGAGRHATQRGLVAAIRAKGYVVERDGRTLTVSKIERTEAAA